MGQRSRSPAPAPPAPAAEAAAASAALAAAAGPAGPRLRIRKGDASRTWRKRYKAAKKLLDKYKALYDEEKRKRIALENPFTTIRSSKPSRMSATRRPNVTAKGGFRLAVARSSGQSGSNALLVHLEAPVDRRVAVKWERRFGAA